MDQLRAKIEGEWGCGGHDQHPLVEAMGAECSATTPAATVLFSVRDKKQAQKLLEWGVRMSQACRLHLRPGGTTRYPVREVL